jgi:hypothetical protein
MHRSRDWSSVHRSFVIIGSDRTPQRPAVRYCSVPRIYFGGHFLAYCAGTGGSILIIGSAAGVAAMGIERIQFIWYMRRIAWLAMLGYFAGAAVYVVQFKMVN